MIDAPLGSSWLETDLKKGWTCRQTSSPGFKPSHIPLKSRTFSSSRDMISVSFCLNKSDQQRQTIRKRDRQVGKYLCYLEQTYPCFLSHKLSVNSSLSPLISLALVSSCLLSSSVSLGIPSSSSFSLSNQGRDKNQINLGNYAGLKIYKPSFTIFMYTFNVGIKQLSLALMTKDFAY